MTEPIPAPSNVEADPKRPYKAYVATAIALLGLVWANLNGVEDWGDLDLQDWVTIIVPAILTFAGTYLVENPKVVPGVRRRAGERGYGAIELLVGLVIVVILIVVLFKVIALI